MPETHRIKRFYKKVSFAPDADGFIIQLDGRSVKTKGRNELVAPTELLACAIAEEWSAQEETMEQGAMPLTGLASKAIDADKETSAQWREDVLAYLGSDLLCYRADAPAALMARQAENWNPYLDWFEEAFGHRLKTTAGIVAIEQPAAAIAAVKGELAELRDIDHLALRSAVALTGSAVLGLAARRSAFPSTALFEASRLDESFQAEKWGVDEEAAAREEAMRAEFGLLCRLFALLRG